MDGRVVGRGCLALMLHVVYKGRALPLAWRVRQSPKGHCPEERPMAMVDLMSTVVPKEATVVFLGDGECDGAALQARLSAVGWADVCHTAMSRRRRGRARPFVSRFSVRVSSRGGGLRYKKCLSPERRMVQSWECVVGPRGVQSPGIWSAIGRQQRRRVACSKAIPHRDLFLRPEKPRIP